MVYRVTIDFIEIFFVNLVNKKFITDSSLINFRTLKFKNLIDSQALIYYFFKIETLVLFLSVVLCALVNFHEHVAAEFHKVNIDNYFLMGGTLDEIEWRTYAPQHFFQKVDELVIKRIS